MKWILYKLIFQITPCLYCAPFDLVGRDIMEFPSYESCTKQANFMQKDGSVYICLKSQPKRQEEK